MGRRLSRPHPDLLPPDAPLARPYGLLAGPPGTRWRGWRGACRASAARPPRSSRRSCAASCWLQLRTRVLDDHLLRFLRGGGRQVVLLGAGFDARAARFPRRLKDAVVFGWTTRRRSGASGLGAGAARCPARKAQDASSTCPGTSSGSPSRRCRAAWRRTTATTALPALTIWEGVTMYLTEEAFAAAVAAVAELSAPGSPFAITYRFERERIRRPPPANRLVAPGGRADGRAVPLRLGPGGAAGLDGGARLRGGRGRGRGAAGTRLCQRATPGFDRATATSRSRCGAGAK